MFQLPKRTKSSEKHQVAEPADIKDYTLIHGVTVAMILGILLKRTTLNFN